MAAAVGGAFAGSHPTGTHVVDPLETALFAGLFSLLCSRSARGTWLLVGVAAALLSRGWLLAPAAATALVAFGSVVGTRVRSAPLGALVGALGVQVMLRWPPRYFHGFPTLAAAAVVVVCTASAWWSSSRRWRRRTVLAGIGLLAVGALLSLPLVIAALLVRGDVSRGQTAANAAFHEAGGGSSTSVATQLEVAKTDTSRASSALGAWWTAGARLVPVVAQQGRLLSVALRAARDASSVGVQQVSALDYHNLEYHHGHINLIRLRAIAVPARLVDQQLHLASAELRSVESSWLLGPIQTRVRTFGVELLRTTHTADLARQAVRVLPGLLGGDGVRNYLIAFMSPSESRGYDGFIGSYGVLTADNGHVTLTQSGQATDIEGGLPPSGAQLTGVPQFLARYGAFDPGKFARDATYSPDLPTDADVFAQIYEQSGGGHIDGVLAIDPYGLAALLQFTGPIDVPGLPVPLTSANAARVLLIQQYTTFGIGLSYQDVLRHDFLQAALHLAFDKLLAGTLPSPKSLSAMLDPEVTKGRISFWSFHPNEQPLLRHLGIDGSFPTDPGQDLLAVTTQNSGNNKIDAFLHKTVNDRVSVNPATGAVSSTVTIRMVNDAPASGLPAVDTNGARPGVSPGTNATWLTIYSPLLFDRVSINGVRSSMTVGKELGVNAYSQFVNIPSESTVTFTVHLIGHINPGRTYRLAVRLQPSANSQHTEVEVVPTAGWRLAGGGGVDRWSAGATMRQAHTFDFVPE